MIPSYNSNYIVIGIVKFSERLNVKFGTEIYVITLHYRYTIKRVINHTGTVYRGIRRLKVFLMVSY